MAERTVIEWDKDDIDALGMLKIDLLALGMLSCVRKALQLANDHRRQRNLSMLAFHTVPAEDRAVYEMICRADTIGVFQIESRAQMSMLPRLRPRSFYDLVIEVAIVRPGPIQGDMVHPYLRRRDGKEAPFYPDAKVKEVLGRTLGIPLFQEQAMALAVVAAGFSAGEADELRRAMAAWRKKSKLIDHFHQRFVSGMRARGYSEQFAEASFNQLRGFSEYGFPESHAASFALIVYVSAWLKWHYPAQFAAALVNSQPMGFYQPAQIIRDAQAHGVSILPIDANFSSWDCTIEGIDQRLRLGLRVVRGLTPSQAEKLLAARGQEGHFTSLAQIWRASGMTLASMRHLARADAFCSLGRSRQEALWEIRRFRDQPLPLLEQCPGQRTEGLLPPTSLAQQMLHDYQTTGLSLRAHPLQFVREQIDQPHLMAARELRSVPRGQCVFVAGLVLVRQRPYTASGVVFMTLEDETGLFNLIIKSEVFERERRTFFRSTFLLVHGRIERAGAVQHILVDQAWDLADALPTMPQLSRDFH